MIIIRFGSSERRTIDREEQMKPGPGAYDVPTLIGKDGP
jgi:hypothetical protein